MKDFRCLGLAIELYKLSKKEKLKYSIKDQLLRASSSVALNLSEGNQRLGLKDRRRFFNIALTSLREVQCICELEELKGLGKKADQLGAMLYALNRRLTEAVTDSSDSI